MRGNPLACGLELCFFLMQGGLAGFTLTGGERGDILTIIGEDEGAILRMGSVPVFGPRGTASG